MKKNLTLLMMLFSFQQLIAKDYTAYNNLTTVANKLIIANRFEEANIIYDGINLHYSDYFKTPDLYYWGKSLAHVKQNNNAYEKIKWAIKLHNDPFGVLYRVKKDSIFSFISSEQLAELKNIKTTDYSEIYNKKLADTINYFLLTDQGCQAYYSYEVHPLAEGEEKKQKFKEFGDCLNSNVTNFIDYVVKNGYPNYITTFIDPIVILFHLNNDEQWKRIENELKKALKNGYIRPFDYAYIYFRSHQLDEKFEPLSYPAFSNKNEQKKFLAICGELGLGI